MNLNRMRLMGKQEKNEQELSDLELISRCSESDVRAQELLYRRYFSFAMSVAVRYTCNEGEAMEIVNDSFMKVLENSTAPGLFGRGTER